MVRSSKKRLSVETMGAEEEVEIPAEWKPEMKEAPLFEDRVSRFTIVRELVAGVLLRVVAIVFFSGYLQNRPELVTPLSSISRLREAIHLKRSGFSAYDGDLFHMQPVFLAAFDVVIDLPFVIPSLFILFDVVTALVFRHAARAYMRDRKLSVKTQEVQDIPHLVFLCYFFNPITIASSAVFNITAFSNLLIALFFLAVNKQCVLLSAFVTSLLVHQNLHYIPVFAVQIVGFKMRSTNSKVIAALLATLTGFGCWNALSAHLQGSNDFLPNTYEFSLLFPDLHPNMGIFWYHFCMTFEHFQSFFTWVFQVNYLLYIFPLAFILRGDPSVYFVVMLITMATFAPYPTLADICVYLALIPMFTNFRKYIRYTLVIGCAYISCLVLSPIMWKMWIITGSGNANFYFAATILYDVAQIFLITDIVYAFLRADIHVSCPRNVDVDKVVVCFSLGA
ncbi:hypothetical protein QR680_009044 [Steinernema hermaphroditum]|uniref:GPI transamidase subunit PIG-U n=1 Tax=Steinernema hermaphroditum TaxID=289476 RepID=A0AA39IIT6_9BILA|nr:hypothetical protein QR680_009044 [Steinernema hermaphroditum]